MRVGVASTKAISITDSLHAEVGVARCGRDYISGWGSLQTNFLTGFGVRAVFKMSCMKSSSSQHVR